MSASPWASAARSDPSPDGRRGRMLSSGHDLDLSCTATCPVQERFHESASPAQAAGSRQETLARRAAGRRQVRFHVHEPGRANARPAPGSGSRPVARTGARRADPRGLAGGRAQRREHRRRAQERQGLFHRRHRCRHRQPRRRDRGRCDRPGGRRHRARAGLLRTRQAHHHGQRRGRRAGRPAAGAPRARPASSIRWPTATSPR